MRKLIVMALLALCANMKAEENIDKTVNALYSRMTQQERIAQLRATYLNNFFTADGRLDTAKCREILSSGIGHFSQFASQMSADPNYIRDRVAVMQEWLMKNTPSGIPALFHEEVLTGACTRDATVYPQQIGLACSFNPALAERKAIETGRTLRQIGGLLSLSPMVDVVRTPSFNRIEESYGEDAYLSAAFGTAFVRGLQNGGLRKGVGTCSKHFLGYGGGGDAPEQELMEDILLPHETMLRLAGNKVIMTGYHAVDGMKCVANSRIQQGILRQYLGFDGMMVSDYGSIDQIPVENLPAIAERDALRRCVAAMNAGNDVDFPHGRHYALMQEALDKGYVSPERFEQAVKNVLRYKAMVGLLDKEPEMYSAEHITFDTPAERQTAYQLATQSVVLLKNDNILPLKKSGKIFLTGPNANTMWAMLGDYTFHSMRYFWQHKDEDDMHPRIVGLKEGLLSHLPYGMTLDYERGCDWTDTIETWIDKTGDMRSMQISDRRVSHPEQADMTAALSKAAQSDVIIAAVGENVLLCGENRQRPTLRLPGSQEEFVEKLIATGKPVVLVVFGGRAQVISRIADRCAAVIQAWYPGEEGGNALADIIYGNVSPSGKLSVTYPAEETRTPICYKYAEKPKAQYEFGYGLSYTSFGYSNLSVAKKAKTTDETVTLSFDVTNTGNMKADEIVQIYIGNPSSLQGFCRVTLAPGETRTLAFDLQTEQFGHYADGKWHIKPGTYHIGVGASSADIRLVADVTLKGKEITIPLRKTYFAKEKTAK